WGRGQGFRLKLELRRVLLLTACLNTMNIFYSMPVRLCSTASFILILNHLRYKIYLYRICTAIIFSFCRYFYRRERFRADKECHLKYTGLGASGNGWRRLSVFPRARLITRLKSSKSKLI